MFKRWIVVALLVLPLFVTVSAAARADGDEQEITIVMGDPSKGEFTFTPDMVMLKNRAETKLIIIKQG